MLFMQLILLLSITGVCFRRVCFQWGRLVSHAVPINELRTTFIPPPQIQAVPLGAFVPEFYRHCGNLTITPRQVKRSTQGSTSPPVTNRTSSSTCQQSHLVLGHVEHEVDDHDDVLLVAAEVGAVLARGDGVVDDEELRGGSHVVVSSGYTVKIGS